MALRTTGTRICRDSHRQVAPRQCHAQAARGKLPFLCSALWLSTFLPTDRMLQLSACGIAHFFQPLLAHACTHTVEKQ